MKKFEIENKNLLKKITELDKLKEMKKENEKLINDFEKQCGEIQFLKKELRDSKPIIELLRKDLINDRDKNKNIIFEKKKLECEVQDLKNQIKRLETIAKKNMVDKENSVNSVNENERKRQNSIYNFSHLNNSDLSAYAERILELENEIQSLKIEKIETLNSNHERLDRINKLINENDKLTEQSSQNLNEIEISEIE